MRSALWATLVATALSFELVEPDVTEGPVLLQSAFSLHHAELQEDGDYDTIGTDTFDFGKPCVDRERKMRRWKIKTCAEQKKRGNCKRKSIKKNICPVTCGKCKPPTPPPPGAPTPPPSPAPTPLPPSPPWGQCGHDGFMCSNEIQPVRNRKMCQDNARKKKHTFFHFTPYQHFGLCGTAPACPAPRDAELNPNGKNKEWKIYAEPGKCVVWATTTTTTTTTKEAQTQTSVDKSLGFTEAAGGCSDGETQPEDVNLSASAWSEGSDLGYGLKVRLFPVTGLLSKPWNLGPGQWNSVYGTDRHFYPVARSDGKEGVVWRDATSRNVFMTWFAADLDKAESVHLYTRDSYERLMAAVSDGRDAIVLITAQDTKGGNRSHGVVRVLKFDSTTGTQVAKQTFDSGWGFNKNFPHVNSAAAWNVDVDDIVVAFPKLNPVGGDNIQHQNIVFFVLNASALTVKHQHWQAAHSFQNSIMASARPDKHFLAMDLSDVYRRGINLFTFYAPLKCCRFKENSGEYYKPEWEYPYYTYKEKKKIVYSTAGLDFYDNQLFAELAHPGLADVGDGFLAFFTGEQPPMAKPSRGHRVLNKPRNIGFVKGILSPGRLDWKNVGVNFITNQSSTKESVSRVKTFKLSSGNILLSYEVWTTSKYVRTEMMELHKDGNVVRAKWEPCWKMQLPFSDDPVVRGGKGIAYAGSKEGLLRYEICVGDDC